MPPPWGPHPPTECHVTQAWAASTWFWKFLPFYEDQLPYIGLQLVLARHPDCWIGTHGYLEHTWTWVHFWEWIGIERFHWAFGIGVGTDPLFYKILKPKSNSWWVPSCDFNQNQIGFLITIWFCFRFLSRDIYLWTCKCVIFYFFIYMNLKKHL